MKEAEDADAKPTGPSQGAAAPSDEKLDKDMKGLVYQGEPQESEAPQPEQPGAPEEKHIEEGIEKGQIPSEGGNILDFSEKEGSRLRIILLLAIVVIIIVAVAYLVLHAKGRKSSITITTTIKGSNTPTTTISGPNFNKTAIINIDVLYNYTGPSTNNYNRSCGKSKYSTVESYTNRLNASTTFYLYDQEESGLCSLTISKYVITTPGFRVISVVPQTPFTLPANSSKYVILKVLVP